VRAPLLLGGAACPANLACLGCRKYQIRCWMLSTTCLHAAAARTARAAWEATQQLLACRQPLSARGRDRLDLALLTSTRGAAANQPDATSPTCTRSKPTRETKIPAGKTTRFHSNQKPSEGTGEKGLHSLRITVQVFKNSWEISKPRRGEEGGEQEQQKNPRGATGAGASRKREGESGEGERYLSLTNSRLKD